MQYLFVVFLNNEEEMFILTKCEEKEVNLQREDRSFQRGEDHRDIVMQKFFFISRWLQWKNTTLL